MTVKSNRIARAFLLIPICLWMFVGPAGLHRHPMSVLLAGGAKSEIATAAPGSLATPVDFCVICWFGRQMYHAPTLPHLHGIQPCAFLDETDSADPFNTLPGYRLNNRSPPVFPA